jgi:pentapeptide repeat protein
MLERWKALPRSIQWLIGAFAAVVLTVAVAWVLLVPAADWLARHDAGSAKGAPVQAARDAARGRLLTLAAGLVAAGALLFTARSFILSREGHVTDRYTKAIEQLGSQELDVRVGGIYALERVARDSKRDHPTVMEVLSAFIRVHSNQKLPPTDPDSQGLERFSPRDVQAAVAVVGRRDVKCDTRPLHLTRADLRGANLRKADLTRANLTGAHLSKAHLRDARLCDSRLRDADLSGARLFGADLTGANLTDVKLRSAKLGGANLTGANLTGADLTGADFNAAILSDALWPGDAAVPEGWKLDTGSGRLVVAYTDSGPTEAN